MSLSGEIRLLAGELAKAAQEELDAWKPDSEGHDELFGHGGACDAISQRLGGVLVERLEGIELAEGGWEGDDHAFVLATRGGESVAVDIPAFLYERGGGYSWRKIEGVKLEAQDVVVEEISLGVGGVG